MTKTTIKTPEQLEFESTRERREQMVLRHINKRFQEWEAREAETRNAPTDAGRLRRLFPFRLRLERLK